MADVPELDGAHTWARSLPVLDRAIREVIVLAADLPDDTAEADLDVEFDFHTGDSRIDQDATDLRVKRHELALLSSEVSEATEEIAEVLVARGTRCETSAALTGVSYQRVSQLVRREA